MGGKAFVYTPQGIQSSEQNINYLNINKSIKSIAVGDFDKDSQGLLLFASENTLFCYNILNNSERFYKEIIDGINIISFGYLGP